MNILLVDDDRDSRAGVADFLCEMGHHVTECGNGEEALGFLARGHFPMVLSDIKMPKMSGLDFLRQVAQTPLKSNTNVVLFTGHGDMETAISALRAGAYDYLLKPINIEELAVITERIAEHQALIEENTVLTKHFQEKLQDETEATRRELVQLKKTLAQSIGMAGIGFFSQEMIRLVDQAHKYHTDRTIPVLIQGETGSGKEVIARIIHYGGINEMLPFVDINCAALTPSLFESELFGYEAGAFTGGLAKGQRGKFDLAQGGTIFLDEVAEIPLELQGKLLRVMQEREYYRVGGLKKVKVDVRVICATNVDLKSRVEEGKFREDLYYRLKIGYMQLPPLRERVADILPLAKLFLDKFAKEKGKGFKRIGTAAAKLLENYPWPGNVRELRNAIEWAVFMYNDETLQSSHLGLLTPENTMLTPSQNTIGQQLNPKEFTLPKEPFSLEEYMNRIIVKALEMHGGNRTKTARYLDISRRVLYGRMQKL
ncbi:sigma-54-dependent transcriptional regulator [Desulfotomaculum sp. 1211_IL3151]|uniref:sigma-54-dependent transcriptional regulator n=1 Tax=Desulfotomaculum sp. 1211_IL3151 TaxID=3084055 RepID=UPI002FD99F8E